MVPPPQLPYEWLQPILNQVQTLATQDGELRAERATKVKEDVREYTPAPQLGQLVPLVPSVEEVRAELRQPQVLTPIAQRDWIELLHKFMKMKPPIFRGETDSTTAIYYKVGIKHRVLSLRVDQVQMQRLVAYTLEDHGGKWPESLWSGKTKLTVTWEEFKATLDRQFILEALNAITPSKIYSCEQGVLLWLILKGSLPAYRPLFLEFGYHRKRRPLYLKDKCIPSSEIYYMYR